MIKSVALLVAGLSAMLLLTTLVHGAAPQAQSDLATPAFEQLVVRIEPFSGLGHFVQVEELRLEKTGRCWYKVEGREAKGNHPARSGGVFDSQLSTDRIGRINELLEETRWLTAKGAEGPATHTHPTTVTLTLTRDGKQQSVVCNGQRPEPYASLLHELHGLATQERRVYLYGLGGDAGAEAWAEIGREIAALRGDPYGQPLFKIDYRRYLPIAQTMIRPFYSRDDEELIPAVRLVGHFQAKSELEFLHRMAHDRSSSLRTEAAWALGQIHDEESLPVLVSMMSAPANVEAAAAQLLEWGDAAVPSIVKLIEKSTDDRLERWEHTAGEDMVRAYLSHWDKLEQPIDPRVVAAVREALENADPANRLIRTDYHEQFLQRIEKGTKPAQPAKRP